MKKVLLAIFFLCPLAFGEEIDLMGGVYANYFKDTPYTTENKTFAIRTEKYFFVKFGESYAIGRRYQLELFNDWHLGLYTGPIVYPRVKPFFSTYVGYTKRFSDSPWQINVEAASISTIVSGIIGVGYNF